MSDFYQIPAPASAPESHEKLKSSTLPLAFTGQAMDYFLLVFKTTLLTILSFGLYYPWARAQRLNYVLRNTRVGNHNLVFSGTGREMAVGYAKGLLLYGVGYGLFLYSQSQIKTAPLLAVISLLTGFCVFYGLFPLAVWGARAYRGSRLSYRGIRFGMDRALFKSFVFKTVGDIVLSLLTLGLYIPFLTYNLSSRLANATLWGTEHFHFEKSKRASVSLSFTNLLLMVVSLGLLAPVAVIRRMNFNMSKIRFQGMKVHSDLSCWDGYVVIVFPLLVSTLSLGLLHPWARVFATKRIYSKLRFEGELNLARILQGHSKGTSLGETVGSLLDIDMGLGL